jgi:ketosteroid isomerase-like protein
VGYCNEVSPENVDFVLEGYARWNAGERSPELWRWFYHQDAEYYASAADPDSAIHRGIDAIVEQGESWQEAYPDLTMEPLEAKGNADRVFLWVRFVGHGASSGLPIDMEIAHVLTIRDGKVARLVEYQDRAAGLEAAGLAE